MSEKEDGMGEKLERKRHSVLLPGTNEKRRKNMIWKHFNLEKISLPLGIFLSGSLAFPSSLTAFCVCCVRVAYENWINFSQLSLPFFLFLDWHIWLFDAREDYSPANWCLVSLVFSSFPTSHDLPPFIGTFFLSSSVISSSIWTDFSQAWDKNRKEKTKRRDDYDMMSPPSRKLPRVSPVSPFHDTDPFSFILNRIRFEETLTI